METMASLFAANTAGPAMLTQTTSTARPLLGRPGCSATSAGAPCASPNSNDLRRPMIPPQAAAVRTVLGRSGPGSMSASGPAHHSRKAQGKKVKVQAICVGGGKGDSLRQTASAGHLSMQRLVYKKQMDHRVPRARLASSGDGGEVRTEQNEGFWYTGGVTAAGGEEQGDSPLERSQEAGGSDSEGESDEGGVTKKRRRKSRVASVLSRLEEQETGPDAEGSAQIRLRDKGSFDPEGGPVGVSASGDVLGSSTGGSEEAPGGSEEASGVPARKTRSKKSLAAGTVVDAEKEVKVRKTRAKKVEGVATAVEGEEEAKPRKTRAKRTEGSGDTIEGEQASSPRKTRARKAAVGDSASSDEEKESKEEESEERRNEEEKEREERRDEEEEETLAGQSASSHSEHAQNVQTGVQGEAVLEESDEEMQRTPALDSASPSDTQEAPALDSASPADIPATVVPTRLRRSLFDALRQARSQHTEAGAWRVLDAWWEQVHRSSAGVEALLAAVVELEQSGEARTLKQLLDWMVHVRRVRLPGTPAYNLLMRAAAGAMSEAPGSLAREVRRVEMIFNEMQQHSMLPNDETFEHLIAVYGQAGQPERITAAHKLIRKLGIVPSNGVLRSLLKAYAAANDFPMAEQVLSELGASEGPAAEDLNSLLFAYARQGRAEEIEALLTTALNESAAQAPIDGASQGEAQGLHESEGQRSKWSKGSQRQPRVKPRVNAASFRALLRAHTTAGNSQGASRVFQMLKAHRVTPDAKLLTEIASAFAVARSPAEAEATLLWAIGTGLLVTKSAVSPKRGPRGVSQRSTPDDSEDWAPLYISLVYAYARQELWAEAFDAISEMRRQMPKPIDERPYNVLMGEMARAGEAERASALLGSMETAGVKPKGSSYRTLARAFCNSRQPEKGEDVLLRMFEGGWQLSDDALVELLDSYAFCRKPSEVERVVENLAAFGLKKSSAIHTSLVGCYSLLGLPRAAEAAFNQAFPAGELRPTSLACAWLLCANAGAGDERSCNELVSTMRSLGIEPEEEHFRRIWKAHLSHGKLRRPMQLQTRRGPWGLE